jgi:hypothetical protein
MVVQRTEHSCPWCGAELRCSTLFTVNLTIVLVGTVRRRLGRSANKDHQPRGRRECRECFPLDFFRPTRAQDRFVRLVWSSYAARRCPEPCLVQTYCAWSEGPTAAVWKPVFRRTVECWIKPASASVMTGPQRFRHLGEQQAELIILG